MGKKIITIGEVMMRLSTPGHERFVQASSYEAVFGGSEANVSICLANSIVVLHNMVPPQTTDSKAVEPANY